MVVPSTFKRNWNETVYGEYESESPSNSIDNSIIQYNRMRFAFRFCQVVLLVLLKNVFAQVGHFSKTDVALVCPSLTLSWFRTAVDWC